MKTRKIVIVAVCLAMAASIPVWANITGSEHDFSTDAWSGGEICIVCHAPHDSDTLISEAPLWNHEVTTTSFTLYSTSTLQALDLGQPDGASKLCLSCHDGTVALDSFGSDTGSSFISTGKLIGTDLSGEHPISFTYDTTLATDDGELFDPSVATTSLGGTIDADLLIANKVQCSSCHDVHDRDTNDKLLVIANTGSALCLTCHDK